MCISAPETPEEIVKAENESKIKCTSGSDKNIIRERSVSFRWLSLPLSLPLLYLFSIPFYSFHSVIFSPWFIFFSYHSLLLSMSSDLTSNHLSSPLTSYPLISSHLKSLIYSLPIDLIPTIISTPREMAPLQMKAGWVIYLLTDRNKWHFICYFVIFLLFYGQSNQI